MLRVWRMRSGIVRGGRGVWIRGESCWASFADVVECLVVRAELVLSERVGLQDARRKVSGFSFSRCAGVCAVAG